MTHSFEDLHRQAVSLSSDVAALLAAEAHEAEGSGFSGVVRVDSCGAMIYESAHGLADRGHHVANTCQTRFAVASGLGDARGIHDLDVKPVGQELAIKARFDPERVVLFGSVAHGSDGPDSDIDLLVVFDHAEPGQRRGLMTKLRRATHHVAAPHDLVVTAVDTYARNRGRPGTIEHEAATSGMVVYERTLA